MMTVNILILNYNGKELLKTYLPSIVKAAHASSHACRVGVIDNQSRDDSVAFLKKEFPDVQIYLAKENRVLCSYNPVARDVSDDILIFMNNDIRVEEDFVDPLVAPFTENADVFFVTPRCLSLADKRYEGNKTRGRIRFGIYWSTALYPGHESECDKPGLTMQGGFGAFDRKKFLELGGYDDLYLPGRLEDADICFRAYQKGWRCLYEPKSIVYHQGGVSFHKEFGVQKTLVINARNTFLFMWKNLSDKMLCFQCAFWLPFRLFYSLASLKPELFLGFIQALPRWTEARRRRKAWRAQGFMGSRSDCEIFNQV